MYCAKCGNQLPDDAKFCDACGTAVELEAVQPTDEPRGRKVTENIILGADGKYHWYYEYRLMKNPTILKLLWKVFFWIFLVMWASLSILNACDGHFNFNDFLDFTKIFALIWAGVEALVAISYFIYAAAQGFKYCVMFDMDEEGVTHTQMQRSFKKAQAISFLTVLMGAAAGKPGMVGTGLLAATKSAMSSTWSSVRSVEIDKRHNVIKVNSRLNKNQVYAEDADFEFVEEFIKTHVTKKCKIK